MGMRVVMEGGMLIGLPRELPFLCEGLPIMSRVKGRVMRGRYGYIIGYMGGNITEFGCIMGLVSGCAIGYARG